MEIVSEWTFCTPCGSISALADDQFLYALKFDDGMTHEWFKKYHPKTIYRRVTPPILSIEDELKYYFTRKAQTFHTPFRFIGTCFQQQVWHVLRQIPYGITKSYKDIACECGNAIAYRAIGQAIRANPLALVVPCHRVIYANGNCGGYAWGTDRKKYLLDLESKRDLCIPF